ncbi:uncharacterized protein PV09_06572 [Verruconis gallopava]|uniref:Mediator of RNA polymerase II transcription subunit 20 n=1 Tax=Verruconis gallopava TaxID=253628 RepID=A0A0D2A5S9_9PEZI|nr:uncharacterized protein PV09_06572 [Verruconis gallopava]KIW02078.1 hypothetical protein PV09_06572 [Verruconis gallopava]
MSTTAVICLSIDLQHAQELPSIKEKVLSKYPTATPHVWGLSLRSLRSTATTPDGKPSSDTQYVVRASHFHEETILAIDTGKDFSTVSIPSEEGDPFAKLLTEKFNTLWVMKMLLAVVNGTSYEIDGVTIRLGELRVPGQAQTVRGLLCYAASSLPQEKIAKALVTNVVESLGFAEAKKTYRTWPSKEKAQEIRLWCDALSQRP